MATLRITQVRSLIGETERHRGIGRTTEREASPETLGMLRKVRHLVKVEED